MQGVQFYAPSPPIAGMMGASGMLRTAPNAVAASRADQIRTELEREASRAGPNANVTISYRYATGADGQVVIVGGTVQMSERVREDVSGIGSKKIGDVARDALYSPVPEALDASNNTPPTLADLSKPRLALSPEEELTLFGEQDAAEAELIGRLQGRDAEVRNHEGLHFRVAGGLVDGLPSYAYQTGPDGNVYAVGGHVKVRTLGTADNARAARDAQTLQLAANAPGDASAADLGAARGAISKGAEQYNKALQSVQDPLYQLAA